MLFAFCAGPWGCAGPTSGDPRKQNQTDFCQMLILAPPVQHARVPLRARDDANAVVRICDEFDLIDIADRAEWNDFCRAAGIDPDAEPFDFSRGRVVGLVAYMGEPMKARWPINLRLIGGSERGGWIEARLGTEFYYQTRSPGYATYTYIEGLAPIAVVHLKPRLFLIDR